MFAQIRADHDNFNKTSQWDLYENRNIMALKKREATDSNLLKL